MLNIKCREPEQSKPEPLSCMLLLRHHKFNSKTRDIEQKTKAVLDSFYKGILLKLLQVSSLLTSISDPDDFDRIRIRLFKTF
jgi:hypothetical protein